MFGVTSDTPVGVEAPFIAGQEFTVEKAKEIEAEGSAYLVTSGTGAVAGQHSRWAGRSPSKTATCGYAAERDGQLHADGRFCTPQTAGNLRIRAEKV